MGLSFLKTIGEDIAKGALFATKVAAQATGYGQILNALLPPSVASKIQPIETRVISDIGKVDDVIKNVEAIGQLSGMSGDQKLTAASGLAATALSDAMSLAGHDIQDQDLYKKSQDEFTAAIRQLTQARVDFLNSLKPKS